jgi:hypothetical protein
MTIPELEARIDQTIDDYFKGNVPIWAQDLWGGVGVPGQEQNHSKHSKSVRWCWW